MKKMIWGLMAAFVLSLLPCSAGAAEGVETGGIHILKTDVTGSPLEGAVFQLVRELEEGELTDSRVEKDLQRIGGENMLMAVVSFWTDREMSGPRVKEVTTNKEGQAAVCGLPYGTYYLVETQAPEGYNRITEPIRVSVHRYSHVQAADEIRDDAGKLLDNTLHIINVRYTLPDTGNLGRIQLIAAGTGIVFSSAALILMNRKKRFYTEYR